MHIYIHFEIDKISRLASDIMYSDWFQPLTNYYEVL